MKRPPRCHNIWEFGPCLSQILYRRSIKKKKLKYVFFTFFQAITLQWVFVFRQRPPFEVDAARFGPLSMRGLCQRPRNNGLQDSKVDCSRYVQSVKEGSDGFVEPCEFFFQKLRIFFFSLTKPMYYFFVFMYRFLNFDTFLPTSNNFNPKISQNLKPILFLVPYPTLTVWLQSALCHVFLVYFNLIHFYKIKAPVLHWDLP